MALFHKKLSYFVKCDLFNNFLILKINDLTFILSLNRLREQCEESYACVLSNKNKVISTQTKKKIDKEQRSSI